MADEGRLTDADMDQLEKWIGTGPKKFRLLYAITRDGCNVNAFHQKCDGQGPTVTVLYNPKGSVYGGYTAVSWDSSSQWSNDSTAFLFQLQYSGTSKSNKLPINDTLYTSYRLSTYGPTFGAGHDLHTFTGSISKQGQQFPLNGHIGFSSYNSLGLSAADLNNGNMNVTELEVYHVSDGHRSKVLPCPWRETPELNSKVLSQLKEEILALQPVSGSDIPDFRLLLLGPVGGGKSSFCNTINSVFRGRITQCAIVGKSLHSTTTALTPYSVRSQSGGTPHFQVLDTRGIEETQGIDLLECNYLLDGHIPNFYKFNPSAHITLNAPEFILRPEAKQTIHCAALVLDATTVTDLSTRMKDKLTAFQGLMYEKGIPLAVLLTKVDKISKDVEKDPACVFKSDDVRKKVDEVAAAFGIPRSSILPVKNYESEMQLNDSTSVIALLALRQILYFADDHVEYHVSQKEALTPQGHAGRLSGGQEADVTESDTA